MNQLNELNKPDPRFHGGRLKELFTSFLFYLSILFFIIGFNFSDTMLGGWTQQFMPNLGGRSITDVFFLDSLTGWAVTNATNQNPDTTYVLKTINGGDNWVIQNQKIQTGGGFSGYFRVYFLNQDTGYVCDVKGIDRTTNGGANWVSLNAPQTAYLDMSVLSTDTIWIVTPDNFMGGVFRTTSGGANWDRQLNLGSQNPNHIYMFNGRMGFISRDGGTRYIRKTTNSGVNWDTVDNNDYFIDMYFADSLTGWKCSVFGMKKTVNGGFNWITQTLPSGGIIQTNGISSFSNINNDTMWANGGYVLYPNNQARAFLNRTVNGGTNWLFQIPDTSILMSYYFVNFVNRLNGWATSSSPSEIHTTTGGGDTFLTSVKQVSSNTPKEFKLEQNYPNPFNPATIIKFQIQRLADLKIIVYDITGKEITTLADKEYKAGTYEVTFNSSNYSSGVYFYSLFINGEFADSRKMILIK